MFFPVLLSLPDFFSVSITQVLVFFICTRRLALVQSRFTDGTKYNATYMFLGSVHLPMCQQKLGVHTLKLRLYWVFIVLLLEQRQNKWLFWAFFVHKKTKSVNAGKTNGLK